MKQSKKSIEDQISTFWDEFVDIFSCLTPDLQKECLADYEKRLAELRRIMK